MKKLKFIAIFSVFVSLLGCEDAYRIEQDGEFGEEVTFQTVGDMQLYLNETYDRATIKNEIGFTAIFTDEVGIGSQNAGQNIELFKYNLNPTDGFASAIWLNHYTLINYANRLLRGAARVTPNSEDATEVAQYNSILAQARALRAFGHFQLLTYFSPDLKNDAALGVILSDRVPELEEKLPRSTNGEVFALIESDLQFASDNLVNPTGANAHQYISTNFINALRARMYAYRGNYTLAGQYADAAISGSGLSLTPAGTYVAGTFYSATSPNPYRRMWADLDRGEVLFSLARPAGKEAVADQFYFNRTNLSGGPYHDMGRNLFNLLGAPENGDIRRRAFVDPTSVVAADAATVDNYKVNDVLLIDKYPGKTGAELTNDLKVFRLSEMYFIKAESLAAAGNINGASGSVAAILKQIRDTRNYLGIAQPLPNYASATEAWADILKERRIELCFEGHRYIDLKRLGGVANVTIDRYFRDCEENNVTTCNLPIADYRFTMPIPVDELIGNPSIQKNTGY